MGTLLNFRYGDTVELSIELEIPVRERSAGMKRVKANP